MSDENVTRVHYIFSEYYELPVPSKVDSGKVSVYIKGQYLPDLKILKLSMTCNLSYLTDDARKITKQKLALLLDVTQVYYEDLGHAARRCVRQATEYVTDVQAALRSGEVEVGRTPGNGGPYRQPG